MYATLNKNKNAFNYFFLYFCCSLSVVVVDVASNATKLIWWWWRIAIADVKAVLLQHKICISFLFSFFYSFVFKQPDVLFVVVVFFIFSLYFFVPFFLYFFFFFLFKYYGCENLAVWRLV